MPAARELAIPIPHERIAEFCRKWGIRKLSFYGSVTRDDFDPARSDVDVLVEVDPARKHLYRVWEAEDELSAIFGRKADMTQPHLIGRWVKKYVYEDLVDEYVEEV